MAPFAQQFNRNILTTTRDLVGWLSRREIYNYMIDRFGQVYRIVSDKGVAVHAGVSIWSDDDYYHLNLNESFIGVAFESQWSSGRDIITPAQVQAALNLTDVLRARYRIADANCVPHGLVSVNAAKKLVGYHADLGEELPLRRSRIGREVWARSREHDRVRVQLRRGSREPPRWRALAQRWLRRARGAHPRPRRGRHARSLSGTDAPALSSERRPREVAPAAVRTRARTASCQRNRLLEKQDSSNRTQFQCEREMDFHRHLRPHLTQYEKAESQCHDSTETFTTNKHQYDSSQMYKCYTDSPSQNKRRIERRGIRLPNTRSSNDSCLE